jgi:hypothetical protein
VQVQTVIDESGTARTAAGRWEVTTPRDLARGRIFRRVVRLRFETHGLADAIAVDPAQTALEASFAPYEADALLAGPLAATLSSGGTTAVVVQLDAPRQVRSVKLKPAVVLDASSEIRLHRIDQATVAGTATVTATLDASTRAASFGGDFTDRRFALAMTPALSPTGVAELRVRSYPAGPRIGLAQPGAEDAAVFFWQAPGELGKAPGSAAKGIVHGGAALAEALQRHVDVVAAPLPRTLDVALVIESDAPCAVDVTQLRVQYRFVTQTFRGPLLHVSDVATPATILQALQALADPVSRALFVRLEPQLQHRVETGEQPGPDLLERLVAGLNAVIDGASFHTAERFAGVTLTAETTALLAVDPTGVDLQRLNRLLLEQAYPGAIAAVADKRVLRFAGDRERSAEVVVQLPAGATVTTGSLTCVESFGGARAETNGDPTPVPPSKAGLHIGQDRWLAAPVAVEEPVEAAGLQLALVALAAKTELLVELQDDWQGAPSGRKLAGGSVAVPDPGRAAWATLLTGDSTVLQPQAYWLVVKAAHGEAVWLSDAAAGDVRVLTRTDANAPWGGEGALRGRALLYRLVARGGRVAAAPATRIAVGDGPAPTLVDEQDGRKTYDVALPLNVGLLGRNSTPAIPLALTLTAGVPGLVTVYPPRVEYELGS